ncbi:MAG TPA: hypothetical protein VL651_03345 [Bacteroidia bacterium]|nr:hypothetical protein [Bacteroidia bacterium]
MKSNFKKHIVPAIVTTFFLVSCFGEKNQKQLDEIKDLRAKLTEVDSMLKGVDAEYAESKAAEVKNNAQFIQFNIQKIGDTLDFQTALFLDTYHTLLRSFETVAESHDKISETVDSTRNGLDDLEHDIRENSLAEGLTPEGCLEREQEQVNYLYDNAKQLRSMLDKAKAGDDTLTPKVNQYMTDLKVKLSAMPQ